jgi:hypothetical protein
MNFRFQPPVNGVIANMGSLFGLNKAKDKDENNANIIDTDEDGKVLFKEDIIHKVLEELEKRKTERNIVELQWTLNANFLVGNQYCEIHPYQREIAQLEPVYDWLERETFNQIAPLIETRIANLKKINYMMRVKPATNELSDYDKAETSTSVLQHTQKVTDFESKKNTAIHWNELCGNCFWLSWWDKDKGEKFAVEQILSLDDNGVEQSKETAYYQGDLDYGLITPYEIYPESIFKQTIEAQRSIILEQVKTVDEIYDLYGIKVEGSNVETFELTPVASGGGFGYVNTTVSIGHRSMDNAEKVITYFEKPSKHKPNGQMIIIVGDEHLVYYGDLPYSSIPIVQTVCIETPGQFFGKSTIERMIPIQKAYNGCVNRIHEYIKQIAIGSYIVEEGSIDIEEYEQNGKAPGAMLVYKNGLNPPIPIQNGNLPQEIMTERYNLKQDLEYAAGVSQLMVYGQAPSGMTSGKALNALTEIDNTRLSLTGDNIRTSVRKLATLWLEIYKKYATTRRIVNYVGGNNIAKAIVWSNEDINSYDVDYVTENELLMSEDAQKERFFEAYNMGLFTDKNGVIPTRVKQKAKEYMKCGNYTDIMTIDELQIQAAQRENVFFENGVIPEVSDFDEHEIHIEEHLRYVLQMDFQLLKNKKPEYAKALENHLIQHKEIVAREEQQAMMMAQMPQM